MENIYKTITYGEVNSHIVRLLQERLIQAGTDLKRVDGLFGENTLYAVKTFQRMHLDMFANPLKVDGIVGPLTWHCLLNITNRIAAIPSPLTVLAIQIAQGEVGVREDPPYSNRGPEVEKYLGCVGLGPKYPWCAAFVYYCFNGASVKLNRANPLVKTASCMNHWHRTFGIKIRSEEVSQHPSLIEPGLIFIISRKYGRGHTGIVTGYLNGIIHTIEGNASANYSFSGDGVVELERRLETINVGFIKYS